MGEQDDTEDAADAEAARKARASIEAGEPVIPWEQVKAEAGLQAGYHEPGRMNETCPECGHLLQHHYDDGCARCSCRMSNTEAGYRRTLEDG